MFGKILNQLLKKLCIGANFNCCKWSNIEPWSSSHAPKVMSLNPATVYWTDIFSHLFVVKIVMCV